MCIITRDSTNTSARSENFDAQVMYVQGRQFPVSVYYAEKAEQNYVDATVASILQIHFQEPSGDILSFLTGREEIENVTKLLRERVKLFPPHVGKLLVCPLYAAQTNDQQKLVFQQTPQGCRKVRLFTLTPFRFSDSDRELSIAGCYCH
jgi:ATP-dependent RNA helicase DHX8/PRP22